MLTLLMFLVLKCIAHPQLIQETCGKHPWPTLLLKVVVSYYQPISFAVERIIRLHPNMFFFGTEEERVPDSVVCAGGSVIISPSGTVLAGPNYDGGGALISADLDLGEIVRAKFDFDVVGHYSRPEVLILLVKDHPMSPVSFTSASEKAVSSHNR